MSSNPYQPPTAPAGKRQGALPRPLGGLTLGTTISFSLIALTRLSLGVANLILIGRPAESAAAPPSPLDPLFIVLGLSGLGYVLVLVVGAVLFCFWIYRANVNASALVSSGMEFTPGWAVGWFFVPFANLFKPYQVVTEIYRASSPEADPDFWSVAPVPAFVPLWWGSWLLFNFVSSFVRPLFPNSLGSGHPGPVAIGLESALGVLAAVLLIVVVRSIHRDQLAKARALPQTPRADVGEPRSSGNPLL